MKCYEIILKGDVKRKVRAGLKKPVVTSAGALELKAANGSTLLLAPGSWKSVRTYEHED